MPFCRGRLDLFESIKIYIFHIFLKIIFFEKKNKLTLMIITIFPEFILYNKKSSLTFIMHDQESIILLLMSAVLYIKYLHPLSTLISIKKN